MRIAPKVTFNLADGQQLEKWSRGRSTPTRLVLRSKIILSAADGETNKQIATKLQVRQKTVALWRNRFITYGIDGIRKDAPRPGRKPRINQNRVDEIIDKTLHIKPKGATHWSNRSLAKEVGVSHATVQRIWKSHKLQPHRERGFKLRDRKSVV